MNEEILKNLHKDYPKEVVDKANQIALLTTENPNIYLKYVSDYSERSVNDLIDMLFNQNIQERYFSH